MVTYDLNPCTNPKFSVFLHNRNLQMNQSKTSIRFFDDREMFITGIDYSYYYE